MNDSSGCRSVLEKHFHAYDWLPLIAGLTLQSREPDMFGVHDANLFHVAKFAQNRDAELAQFIAENVDPSGGPIAKRWEHAFLFPGADKEASDKVGSESREVTTSTFAIFGSDLLGVDNLSGERRRYLGLAGRGRSVAHPAEKTITANSSLRRGEPQRCANLLPSDCLPRQGIVPPNEDITLEPNRAFIDRGGLSPFFG